LKENDDSLILCSLQEQGEDANAKEGADGGAYNLYRCGPDTKGAITS